ncbi:aromatic ring-hydroxylating oxygenase subunit alpha [Actinoplanes sp. CA-131856]
MAIAENTLQELVSVQRGEVDRRVYSDPDIYEQEMADIFQRSWLFLCHESQIPKRGDFVETPMGRDNVLVVRQRDGSIKALHNTCAHRGNAVCRADEGNAKNFMCTYHGWTYDIGGNLVGVPGQRDLYHDELDTSRHGLRGVAQLDSYKGFVFATSDPTAPPLFEFLGRTGRAGLDLIALQGDMEIIPGIQKFVIPCNWKLAVDNLFDWYHPQITHLSAFSIDLLPAFESDSEQLDIDGVTNQDGEEINLATKDNVSTLVFLDHYGHAMSGPVADGASGPFGDISYRHTEAASKVLGPQTKRAIGHTNVFPTLWIAPNGGQLSLRIPRGPYETEIWWYTFVPKEAPPEVRAIVQSGAVHVFGPAGLLEQEDGENWSQATMTTHGLSAGRIPHVLKMNLGRGKVVNDPDSLDPPWIEAGINEHGQLWTYAAWAQWMSGCGWDDLRERTTPPAVL